MTPEQRVIQAAINEHPGGCAPETCGGSTLDPCSLANAIEAYQRSNDKLDSVPISRRRLAGYLSEYAHGVIEEWMRIVEIDADIVESGTSAFQARATWQGDGTFTLGPTPYSAEFGRYRLIVHVEALPDLPPVGPENDPALAYEIEPVEPEPVWMPAEWQYVLQHDHVRVNGQEADVSTSSNSVPGSGSFHADNTNASRPIRWDHKEVRVRLVHLGEQVLQFPPAAPVEILMDRERQAIHLLASQF